MSINDKIRNSFEGEQGERIHERLYFNAGSDFYEYKDDRLSDDSDIKAGQLMWIIKINNLYRSFKAGYLAAIESKVD